MDTFFKILNVVITIVVLYIGYKQTQKYRSEDKKEKLQIALHESHRKEIKTSIEGITQTLKTTRDDILFMFDNHGHKVQCANSDCGEIETSKMFIVPPQQNRRATDPP